MANRKSRIIRYKKPINLNIGVVIFAFLFLYLGIVAFMYFTKDHVQMYQVREGSLSESSRYVGLALRSESVSETAYSGYINYYLREGSKAAVGNLLYSVDENGKASEYLSGNTEDKNNLSDENLAALRSRLSRFSADYDPMNFSAIYDVRYQLQSSLLEYVNAASLKELQEILKDLGSYFQLIYAPSSGIVVYQTDGYETFDPAAVKASDLDRTTYKPVRYQAGQLVEAGSPICRTVTEQEWSLIIPVTEADALVIGDSKSIRIRFPDTGIETRAACSTFVGADGKVYGKLDLNDYMVRYCDARYVDVELIPETPSGLKIPVSSIVRKDFFIIPTSFLTTGGDSSRSGFLREVYVNGESSTVFETPTIYHQTEEYCYVERSAFSEGDNLVRPDSTEQYKIGPSESLTGVFNINRGYAVFRHVEILAQDKEYAVAAIGTRYGLSPMDHIVLNGLMVKEDDIIY